MYMKTGNNDFFYKNAYTFLFLFQQMLNKSGEGGLLIISV